MAYPRIGKKFQVGPVNGTRHMGGIIIPAKTGLFILACVKPRPYIGQPLLEEKFGFNSQDSFNFLKNNLLTNDGPG